MKILTKGWMTKLAALVFVLQSTLVSATIITDLELEFSAIDDVVIGESFDVDVFMDIADDSELVTFGFNFTDLFTNVLFDGFSVADWMIADDLNDVGGLAFPFGPNGDNVHVATLHFTAVSTGQASNGAYGELFENGGGAYFYNFIDDAVYDMSLSGSFDVNVVPEPSSLALMLLGVFGLARLRATKSK